MNVFIPSLEMGLSRNINIITISCVFSVLAFISVSLRFYCRSLKRARCGADESLILPALVKRMATYVSITLDINSFSGFCCWYGNH